MGTRERYAPGTFCWEELATSDLEGAKAFYGEVLGWAYEDLPLDDGQVYVMATVDGHRVAALMGTEHHPHWRSYVSVEDVDAAAARVIELGGSVRLEPFDVMDAGRLAGVADPTGASVMLWQPGEHPGAGLVNVPGALSWNDLQTTDVGAAADFYAVLLGWRIAAIPSAPGGRVSVSVGGRLNGGIAALPPGAPGMPPEWLPFFAVEDVSEAVGVAHGAGARVLAPPMEVPSGSMAVLVDPQQAAFAVLAGDLED